MREEQLNDLMAQSLVAHIPGARRGEAGVELGGGVVATCHVEETHPPILRLDLTLSGGPFGDVPVTESFAGVGSSYEESVVLGVHGWVSSAFPAVRALLLDEPAASVCDVHGSSFDLFEGSILSRGASVEALERALDAGSAVRRLLGALPVLSTKRAHLVSCFGARISGREPTLEVKVDGWPWPAAELLLAPLLRVEPWSREASYSSFRQSAVLRPSRGVTAARPSWEGILQTLRGLALSDPALEVFGATAHRYQFSPPLEKDSLAAIAALGVTLPEEYYDFITRGLSSGAGPGYGLLPPHTPPQLEHLRGRFPGPGSSGLAPGDEVKGTLALAHLGCGYFDILVVDGPARGQVFADVRSAGAGLVPTHASFLDWYLDWLDRALTGRWSALPIRPGSCALPQAISKYLQGRVDTREAISALAARSICTSSEQSDRYFDEGDPLDLCRYCAHLQRHLGISAEQLVPGSKPKALRGVG